MSVSACVLTVCERRPCACPSTHLNGKCPARAGTGWMSQSQEKRRKRGGSCGTGRTRKSRAPERGHLVVSKPSNDPFFLQITSPPLLNFSLENAQLSVDWAKESLTPPSPDLRSGRGTRSWPSGCAVPTGSATVQTRTHNPCQSSEPSTWAVLEALSLPRLLSVRMRRYGVFARENLPKGEASRKQGRAEERPGPKDAGESPKPAQPLQRPLLP